MLRWPQAKLHTQWPGDGPNKGRKGDPIFDAFYATQVETVISNEQTQQRNKEAGAALLDRIGPAVVLTHSQSGAFGWLRRPASARQGDRCHRTGRASVRGDDQWHRQGPRLGNNGRPDHL